MNKNQVAQIEKKISILKNIFEIIQEELISYENTDKLNLLIEKENIFINELKDTDKKITSIPDTYLKTITELTHKIDSSKKELIRKYKEYFESWQKQRESSIINKKNLTDSYFQKNTVKPRFINKLK
jgi:hypothetical protein